MCGGRNASIACLTRPSPDEPPLVIASVEHQVCPLRRIELGVDAALGSADGSSPDIQIGDHRGALPSDGWMGEIDLREGRA
jgi:hypothetical protein